MYSLTSDKSFPKYNNIDGVASFAMSVSKAKSNSFNLNCKSAKMNWDELIEVVKK